MRRPLASLVFATIAWALAHGGATEIGEARLKPTRASSISAASSAVRASGPWTWQGSQASGIGQFGVNPGVGRMPTMPQNDAGMRIEQPKSVPCANGTIPVATATAEPPEEPAGLNAGFQGFRVTPNTSLKVLAPAANSGVLVLPMTMAPAAFSRRTASASSAKARAASATSVTMALSLGLTRAMVARCASSTSTGLTALLAIIDASPTAVARLRFSVISDFIRRARQSRSPDRHHVGPDAWHRPRRTRLDRRSRSPPRRQPRPWNAGGDEHRNRRA